MLRRVGPSQQDDELVATEPRDQVAGADDRTESVGHGQQEQVAGGVAEVVVDLLEAVEVEQEEGGGAGAGQGLGEGTVDRCAVGQVGERVVGGGVAQVRGERPDGALPHGVGRRGARTYRTTSLEDPPGHVRSRGERSAARRPSATIGG